MEKCRIQRYFIIRLAIKKEEKKLRKSSSEFNLCSRRNSCAWSRTGRYPNKSKANRSVGSPLMLAIYIYLKNTSDISHFICIRVQPRRKINQRIHKVRQGTFSNIKLSQFHCACALFHDYIHGLACESKIFAQHPLPFAGCGDAYRAMTYFIGCAAHSLQF